MTADQRNYRLGDAAEQRRLDELTDRGHESVADLTHEIGMCRFLIERASASPALCNALLSTCSKLCVSHQLAMERAGTTLPKETILRICLKRGQAGVGGILRYARLTRAARPGHRQDRHRVCRTGRTANPTASSTTTPHRRKGTQ